MEGSFAAEITERRIQLGRTQLDCSMIAGISRTQWHQIENGYVDPRLSTAMKMLAAVNASLIIESMESEEDGGHLPADDGQHRSDA